MSSDHTTVAHDESTAYSDDSQSVTSFTSNKMEAPAGEYGKGHSSSMEGRDEPKDDIKNFAEDTMNELLAWYGYDKQVEQGAGERRYLKPRDKQPPRRSTATDDDAMSATGSTSSATRDKTSIDSSERSAKASTSMSRDVLTDEHSETSKNGSDETVYATCSWCHESRALDKHLMMTSADGDRKFCSEQCFSQCRREQYKKQKVCEWCKDVCCETKFVEFSDGGDTYIFCGDSCLNKFKMNIFCQETQEHFKTTARKSALHEDTVAIDSRQSKILITPELWADEPKSDRATQKPYDIKIKQEDGSSYKYKSTGKGLRSESAEVGASRYRQRSLTHSPCSDYGQTGNSLMRVVALKAKAELEHPKTTMSRMTNNRPPRMTDREKIKQIRMRDKLPLHTPLRETYRGQAHNDMYSTSLSNHSTSPPTLTSSFSNSNPVFTNAKSSSATAFSHMAPNLSHIAPLSPGQIINALTASRMMRPLPGQSTSPEMDRRKDNSDSCSSPSLSPRVTSSETGNPAVTSTPAPPIYPPPNPFSHMLPSYFNLANGPLGFPPHTHPGLAHLSALSSILPPPPPPPPPLLPTSMNSILPPNTLMMPYPFMIPLPIPVPIPIPVPRSMIDACMKPKDDQQLQQPNDVSNTDSKKTVVTEATVHHSRDTSSAVRESCSSPTSDSLACSRCTSSTKKDTTAVSQTDKRRYYLDHKPLADETEQDNRAIDLSTGDSALRHRPNDTSPPPPPPDHATTDNLVVIQPTRLDPTTRAASPRLTAPPTFPLPPLNMLTYTNSRYSSRRSLILDAPASRPDSTRSPSPGDKRHYNTASVRDILYGKRKCARPRIKTK